jgi:hypothetical protein
MFALDNFDEPPHAVVVVARADAKTLSDKERVMGVCFPVQYLAPGEQPGPGEGGCSPNQWASTYFFAYERRETTSPPLTSVEIIAQPKHGKVVFGRNSPGDELLQYIPNAGYVGQDRVIYRVSVEGLPVKLIYFIHVTKKNLEDSDTSLFCRANTWKISDSSPQTTDRLGPHNGQNR